MSWRYRVVFLVSIFAILSIVFASINLVSAADCWSYSGQSDCSADNSCVWKSDDWGGWCEELNCWSINMQENCTASAVPGKNCTWQTGGTSYSCEPVSCGSFEGTNETACRNNSAGLTCNWHTQCWGVGHTEIGVECYDISTESTCKNTTGCVWGSCTSPGCGSYSTNTTCTSAKDWRGNNCTWESSGNYCSENTCWRYQNESACNNVTSLDDNADQDCVWKWNSCQEIMCWNWDFTNETACVNNTANISCEWSMGSWCMEKGCWNYGQSDCNNNPECIWAAHTTGGHCEEIKCWTWDSWNGGNQSDCESNSYGLNCIWSGNPPGNATEGWCYMDVSALNCTNITTERECMDTWWCFWEFNDWNNVSAGGNCSDPNWNDIGDVSIFSDWNPGCYIFDMNSTNCNNILGCNYTNGKCIESNVTGATDNSYSVAINANGINCTHINDSRLCNNIPMLSTCCAWQNSSCQDNKMSTSCWDQMEEPPEGAFFCEDYKAYSDKSLCEQIAGDPWYMPCKWDNSTERCGFNADDVFGNTTQSLMKINNEKNCEAAGGKWITESYCEGNISVPYGRCEYKFDEERNCNKACFACEWEDSDGNTVNATNAESACKGSALGYCEFEADSNAANGIGYCKARDEFKKGIAGDCDADCGACTYKGDSLSNDTTKRPSYFCTMSKANSDGGGCKWVTDNTTVQGGYCVDKGMKTCEDACDRCYTKSDCANLGRTGIANQSGSCRWQGSEDDGNCVANIGQDVEICWDGVDNTNDTLIDCADPSCYADSYCGFVEGDCFGWQDNTTCISKGCEWVVDMWGSWCDFKGSQCWKYEINNTYCNSQTNCEWHNGTGSSWCEKDWSVAERCMGLDYTSCMAANASGCNWTIDTWCQGEGNSSEWCASGGGWCDHQDFKPKDCWMYQSSSSECNNVSDCKWRVDEWSQPHCEVNWSGNCWQHMSNSSCTTAGCYWRSDSWGAWCTDYMDKCWNSWTQDNCESQTNADGDRLCYWDTWGNMCQPACFNSSNSINQTDCNTAPGCYWVEESGWCEEQAMAGCFESNVTSNETACKETTGCRWKSSGWCDPKGGGFSTGAIAGGGGVGGAMGADCYKYDGNQSYCTNKTIINISCGWFEEPSPWCDVDWSKDCWQYLNASSCEVGGCWWYNDSEFGGSATNTWCTNIMDQCWTNASLQNNATWCDANAYCNSTSWGTCEPTCFGQTASAGCVGVSGCRWVTGWCNPAGMNDMFTGMEAGAPIPLGMDVCDGSETNQSSVDICGFGMRDMGESYGFGLGVFDFSNASICYKEKLSSFVMGMGGGHFAEDDFGFGTERVGDGNETIKFFLYLDTDGSTTGGCKLSHNDSAEGYEFRFRYVSEWNAEKAKAEETFTAYKCENSDWKVTDIKLSAWKKKMCSEIGGGMIALEKIDLSRFPSLYNSSADLRVFVATADAIHNITAPSDTAGPGWTTPGAIDFEINDVFSYGADIAKFEDILKKGFVEHEDCFNNMDDDGDGSVDCWDYDCEFAKICEGQGVNTVTDTRAPRVVGVRIEEYYDAALIMYDTNKPTNGTLQFYYNDSRCLNLNKSIHDVGVLKNNTVREYKLWHYASVYNDGGTDSLAYDLVNDTTYYYKLRVCDSGGKCAVSKCTGFMTTSSSKCPYCKFVTRLKNITGWSVYYDLDQDGTYEHWQGHVCGQNSGMKTNYTTGRHANIKLNKTDGTSAIEFFNVTLTKTGLNDKVRTMSNSVGSLLSNSTATDSAGNTIGYAGMISDARDKIIDNLHPELCRVMIPRGDTGCGELWHCNDTGGNCVNRTSEANLTGSTTTTCTWDLPFCEFSVWASGEPGTPSAGDGTSTGGGDGGGGGAAGKTYTITDEQFKEGYTKELAENDQLKMNISGNWHYVKLAEFSNTSIKINVSSIVQQVTLSVGQSWKFDVTDDAQADLEVKLESINKETQKAKINVKSAIGEVSVPTETPEEKPIQRASPTEIPTASPTKYTPSKKSLIWLWILLGIVVIVIAVILLKIKKK